MPTFWKTLHSVALGLVSIGLLACLVAFLSSGLDMRVFTTQIDRGTVVLGGTVADDPESLPLVGPLARLGTIDTTALADNEEGVA